MPDRLDAYRRKRDAKRTPEPVPSGSPAPSRGDTFVVQQHHARSLHWDLRLERDGVLVSWAVPRGIPRDPDRNHLAVHTEDHPMEYATFHGEIPAGEYGAGRMTIYDRGTYATEKWRDDEVIVVFDGAKVSGRYVLFRTGGKRGNDWMIHRMDPLPAGWTRMPEGLSPAEATPAKRLPADDGAYAFELHWPGQRAFAAVSGGRLDLRADGTREITSEYPALRAMAESLAPTECLLDGVVVAFHRVPVYMAFDLLWHNGESTVDEPYAARRERLLALELAGTHWQTPPHFAGGGAFARDTAREQGLPGVIAKRLDAPYGAGDWRAIPAGPRRR